MECDNTGAAMCALHKNNGTTTVVKINNEPSKKVVATSAIYGRNLKGVRDGGEQCQHSGNGIPSPIIDETNNNHDNNNSGSMTNNNNCDNLKNKNFAISNGCARARTEIQNFYAGTNVLITGGTGFMGKMLIMKLLYTCRDIDNIYLLIRSKKGKNCHTRTDDIFDDPIFDSLRENLPKFRHKLVTVNGDCSIPGLGLSLTDRHLLETEINVVIHAAATVRFDEKLKLAVNINVCGTHELLKLCTTIKRLRSVVHVSTAYSNCHLHKINETFYKYQIDYVDLKKLLHKLDDKAIDELTPTILGKWPNTYAFTKALAEDVIRMHSTNLPIGVFRPGIVTSSAREPVIGWIDNLYGPTGVVAGVGTGVLRTMHCNADINANIVPVDMAVNALIACAWDIAKNHEHRSGENMLIYNYVSSVENPLTWGQFTEYNIKNGFDYPFSSAIWYVSFRMHKTAAMNRIYMLFLHFLPAILIDSLAVCVGHKPRLLKIYKKIHKFSNVISFFCTNEWQFSNSNVQLLWTKLSDADRVLFNFTMKTMDWQQYSHHYIRGMRMYLFKDDLSTLEMARRKWKRFYWLHQTFKAVVFLICAYLLWWLLCGLMF